MATRGDMGKEDTHLADSNLAESTAATWSSTDRVLALLGKSSFVNDEDAIGSREARSEIVLEGSDEWRRGPGSLSQEALECSRSSARDSFGKVLGISTVSMLEQQAAQVLLA